MGIGKITLIGRRFDLIDGQRREHHPVAAEGLPIGGENLAAVSVDRVLELTNGGLRSAIRKLVCQKAGGMAGELAPLARCADFFLGRFFRHSICLNTGPATVPNGARWDKKSRRAAPCLRP